MESDVALVITVLRIANRTGSKKKGEVASIPEAVDPTPDGVEELAERTATFDSVDGAQAGLIATERGWI